MATITRKMKDGIQIGFRIRFYLNRKRREIYIPGQGKQLERQITIIAQHVDELVAAKANNVSPAPAATAWANNTSDKLRDNLVGWGLAAPSVPKLYTEAGRFLAPFCDAYINSRSDIAERTRVNFLQCRRLLVLYFGERCLLSTITPADGDRWKRWMLGERKLAVATASKNIKRAKQMFKEAVRDRLLDSNPFADIKGMNEANPARMFYVNLETSARILKACPTMSWKCIFTLARFCGMRSPSEVLALKWTDVDFARGRLRIDSSKTGLRYCPLFPHVRELLLEARQEAENVTGYVIEDYRKGANLGTHFKRIVVGAGIEPWPKIFHNLRSSCRTDLQDQFPSHVIDAWLGHSTKVAEKHYLQVTEDHWARSLLYRVQTSAPICAPISYTTDPICTPQESENMQFSQGFEGLCRLTEVYKMPLVGLEPTTR